MSKDSDPLNKFSGFKFLYKQYLNILINNIKNSCSLKWTLLNYKNTNNECVYDTIIKRWFKERIKIKEEQLEFIHEDNI